MSLRERFRDLFRFLFGTRTRKVILSVVVILIAIRIALPYAVLWYANGQLANLEGGYSGKIEDIDLSLLRGAYSIKGIDLFYQAPASKLQVARIVRVDLNLIWERLLKGQLVGRVVVHSPFVSIYQRMLIPQVIIKKKPKPISEIFQQLLPFRIDLFAIRNAELHYRNYIHEPEFDLYMTKTDLDIRNITNSERLSKTSYAFFDVSGTAMGSGEVTINGTFNPTTELPNFYAASKIEKLDVTEMNPFTRAYAGFDFERGTFSMSSEASVSQGDLTGYVIPVFRDLNVFSWKNDVRGDNTTSAFWDALVGATGTVLKNQPKNQLATRIPISGNVADPEIGLVATIVNVLRNGFVKAFLPRIEGSVPTPQERQRKRSKSEENE